MALICVACRTDNRDAAKFCKGCGGRLVTLPSRSAEEEEALEDAWGATVLASGDDLALPTRARGAAHRASRPSTLGGHGGGSAARPVRRPAVAQAAPPDRSGTWVLLAAAAIVVLTGGWYTYRRMTPLPALAAPAALSQPTAQSAPVQRSKSVLPLSPVDPATPLPGPSANAPR